MLKKDYMFYVKHRKDGLYVYLRKSVGVSKCGGWIQSSSLKPDTKIESYRLDYDPFVEEYLILHLA